MLGIDTNLQISLQTRDVMYAAEKGAQSLLESSEPAGRVQTKPRRSSAGKPEPLLPLEPLNSWDNMRRKTSQKDKRYQTTTDFARRKIFTRVWTCNENGANIIYTCPQWVCMLWSMSVCVDISVSSILNNHTQIFPSSVSHWRTAHSPII